MRIQHNIMAMNAYRNYNNNVGALSKNLEKLSSGYRINRAGDDAAGLAISEKMRAQITGLDAAQKNVKDGISLVKTAEGALQEVQDMMNRMVYLATQSANGTYDNEVDRDNLQKEVDALKDEINRIADSANFNGQKLLNGEMSKVEGVTFGKVVDTSTPDTFVNGEVSWGTEGTAVGGEMEPTVAERKFSTTIFAGSITNSDSANTKNIVLNYNDNTGTAKTVTLTIGKGQTASTKDIADALSGSADGTKITTAVDANASDEFKDGTGKAGAFSDLYEVSVSGNMITITAKASGKAGTEDEVIDGSKLGAVTLANAGTGGLASTDVSNASQLMEDPSKSGNATLVNWGTPVGQDQTHVAAQGGKYILASEKLTLASGTTTATLENKSVKIGGKDYIFVTDTTADLPTGAPTGAQKIEIDAGGDLDKTMANLVNAVNANKTTNNVEATWTSGSKELLIQETTAHGATVQQASGTGALVPKDLITINNYKTGDGQASSTQTVTLDAAKFKNGTTIEVDGKKFAFTLRADQEIPDGAIRVNYSADDTSDQLAAKFAGAVNGASISNLTAAATTGGVVTFTDSAAANGVNFGQAGSGLMLQIGDTADAFNQLEVKVADMHTVSLGTVDKATGALTASLDDVDISTLDGAVAAVDVIKNAINMVSSTRGDLGAIQNRLEHTTNNLSVMKENITDAESSIRDTDVADEMMKYTKNNILIQSAQAMLAQANQVPQGVLQLLG